MATKSTGTKVIKKEDVVKKAEAVVAAGEKKVEEVKAAAEKKIAEMKATEAKVTEDKASKEKAEVKKTVVKKAAAKKETVKKAVAKKDIKVNAFVEYYGKQVEERTVIANVKKAWTKSGKKVGDIKTLDLYIKPEENAAYYVINGTNAGAVALYQE